METKNLPSNIRDLLKPEQWERLFQKGYLDINSKELLERVFSSLRLMGHAVQQDYTPGALRLYHYRTCRLCTRKEGIENVAV